MAKKEETPLDLRSCQQIAVRLGLGYDEAASVAGASHVDEDGAIYIDVSLDGLIGALLTCRKDDREGKTIGWLLDVLVRVRDERDKPQTEMELDGDGEEG